MTNWYELMTGDLVKRIKSDFDKDAYFVYDTYSDKTRLFLGSREVSRCDREYGSMYRALWRTYDALMRGEFDVD